MTNPFDEEVIFRLSDFAVNELDEKLEKLNKKANKLGVPPVSYEIIDREIEEGDSEGLVKVFNIVRVHGEAPSLNGWRFEAKIEHHDDFNMLYPAPDTEVDVTQWSNAASDCDHCGMYRNRNNTYILKNEDSGEVVQVGSSCLKDFLGHQSPQAIADWIEFLQDCDWDLGSSDRGSWGYEKQSIHLSTFLQHVASVVNRFGWVSRAASYYDKEASADTAWGWMIAKPSDRAKYWPEDDGWVITPKDEELAEFAIEYARELSDDECDGNAYLANLRTLAQHDFVDYKSNGLAASMIVTAAKAKEREINRQKSLNLKETSEYVGAVKDRFEIEVDVTGYKWIDGYYGSTHLYNMTDGENAFVWFSSRNVLEQGKRYVLVGTVKKHDEYNGLKQTVLTRCKIVREVEDDS